MATAKLDTLVPTGGPELEPALAAKVRAAKAIAKALGDGPFVKGFMGGLLAVAIHSYVDADNLVPRVETLERAMLAADDHNAWVQEALVALSEDRPLPAPRYRRITP